MKGKLLPGMRFGRVRGLGLVLALLLAQNAFAGTASTTFQVDAAHDGIVNFSKPFAPPLKKKWSINLQGPVSYPVVSGGMVIVVTTGPVGTRLVAINESTGKIAWQKLVDGTGDGGFIASDDDKLFLTTFSGPFQAFDGATGRPLWSTQLPHQLYFNFIPITAYGSVYTGGAESGTDIYALNGSTGALRWQHTLIAGGISPTLGDGKVYMPIPCNVGAYKPATGARAWFYAGPCEGGGSDVAAYYRQRLYAPNNNYNSGVLLDTANGKLVGIVPSLPTFIGNTGYAISGTSLAATNLATGNLRWAFTPKNDALLLPPITINGNIYTRSERGTLHVNSGATGRLLQSVALGLGGATTVWQAPSVGLGAGDNLLFVPSGNILAAFGP